PPHLPSFPTRRSSDLLPDRLLPRTFFAQRRVAWANSGKSGCGLAGLPSGENRAAGSGVCLLLRVGMLDSSGVRRGRGLSPACPIDRKSTRLNSSHLVI